MDKRWILMESEKRGMDARRADRWKSSRMREEEEGKGREEMVSLMTLVFWWMEGGATKPRRKGTQDSKVFF